MDAFSGFLIYASLVALSADPTLWRFHQGENLILSASDLLNPGGTEAWEALLGSRSVLVRLLAEQLVEFAAAPEPPGGAVRDLVEATGDLDDMTIRRVSHSEAQAEAVLEAAAPPSPEPQVAALSPASDPSWWLPRDPVSSGNLINAEPAVDETQHADDGAWVGLVRCHPTLSSLLLSGVAGAIGICVAAIFSTSDTPSQFAGTSLCLQFVSGTMVFAGGIAPAVARFAGRNHRRSVWSGIVGALLAGVVAFASQVVLAAVVNRQSLGPSESIMPVSIVVSLGVIAAVIYGMIGAFHSSRGARMLLIAGAFGGAAGAVPLAIYGVQRYSSDFASVEVGPASIMSMLIFWLVIGLSIGWAISAIREEATS